MGCVCGICLDDATKEPNFNIPAAKSLMITSRNNCEASLQIKNMQHIDTRESWLSTTSSENIEIAEIHKTNENHPSTSKEDVGVQNMNEEHEIIEVDKLSKNVQPEGTNMFLKGNWAGRVEIKEEYLTYSDQVSVSSADKGAKRFFDGENKKNKLFFEEDLSYAKNAPALEITPIHLDDTVKSSATINQ
jgi:hypothetical protein